MITLSRQVAAFEMLTVSFGGNAYMMEAPKGYSDRLSIWVNKRGQLVAKRHAPKRREKQIKK